MRVRILSEWAGSGRCGSVCDVPDAEAQARIQSGWAERVEAPFETAVVIEPELETAVAPVTPPAKRGKARR